MNRERDKTSISELASRGWGWGKLTLGEEVGNGSGGDGEDSRSIQGRLTTLKTQVKISQNIFPHRRRETAGQGGDKGTQKGRCWKWGPTGFII